MNDPKHPVNPETGKRDWEYNPPINRSNNSEEEDDDDDFEPEEGYDPYANNPYDEPIC